MSFDNQNPEIRRVERIIGNKIALRGVAITDAEFILSLRTDPKKSAFLSSVKGDLESQQKWIENYLSGSGQAYFIIEDANGRSVGTVRVYGAREDSFCWGSWIVVEGAPTAVSVESALLVYKFGLDLLGFKSAHFEVDKRNTSVWAFHERFGAKRVEETDIEYKYVIDESSIRASLDRYKRFLPGQIEVREI
ncbi:GNAT family N-acetyltransferase [Paraburkholderia sp. J10-1]|uniref:GNAT family N-acetyltransferase n=1 Tax=Paraburkholderia sp. J10-1 TaxID=2805430 RepID=UPI002AB682B6|nr:GNAT family N-acetyltransferase [Paraburkholderia sp. J10-1]